MGIPSACRRRPPAREGDYLTDAELASLGFRRIAGSDLIYRHSALRSDFSDEQPCGMDVPLDFEAEESDEEWVLREWKRGKKVQADDED